MASTHVTDARTEKSENLRPALVNRRARAVGIAVLATVLLLAPTTAPVTRAQATLENVTQSSEGPRRGWTLRGSLPESSGPPLRRMTQREYAYALQDLLDHIELPGLERRREEYDDSFPIRRMHVVQPGSSEDVAQSGLEG